MEKQKLDLKKETKEWLICIIIALAIILPIKSVIISPSTIKQESMYPTLKPNQKILITRTIRITKKIPERGKIITLEAPNRYPSLENEFKAIYENKSNIINKFIYYGLEIGKTSYIKRVIGLPGENIKIESGKVYINDIELDESLYLSDEVITNGNININIPEDYIFVMGDNRENSIDSRNLGCIPIEKVEGILVGNK